VKVSKCPFAHGLILHLFKENKYEQALASDMKEILPKYTPKEDTGPRETPTEKPPREPNKALLPESIDALAYPPYRPTHPNHAMRCDAR